MKKNTVVVGGWLGRSAVATVLMAGTLAPRPAEAVGWNLRLEGGIAGFVSTPQTARFDNIGGTIALRPAAEVTGVLDLHLVFGFVGFSAADTSPDQSAGLAYNIGGGLRVKRPWESGTVSPWADIDVSYVRTGSLNRFGFTVGAGLAVAVTNDRSFRMGPYLRYQQVVTPDRNGLDGHDARILGGGLSIEYGNATRVPVGPVVALSDDRDHDGIRDLVDRCVAVPEDRDGFEDDDGCPDPDNDKDGIPDVNDRCPNAPGTAAFRGCPEPDRDHDGIPDSRDKCPGEPEDRDGFEDDDGCPDPDNDKDGVPDRDDRCIDQPGSAKTYGCPDRDNDGVEDDQDRCPDVAGPASNDGCPEGTKGTGAKLQLSQKVLFASNSAKLAPKSMGRLDEVVAALNEHKTYRVRIEGHADNKEPAAKKLSQGRAEAVRAYLIGKKIAADRLTAQGLGAEKPIDDNKTEQGRENNRRVEFVVLSEVTK